MKKERPWVIIYSRKFGYSGYIYIEKFWSDSKTLRVWKFPIVALLINFCHQRDMDCCSWYKSHFKNFWNAYISWRNVLSNCVHSEDLDFNFSMKMQKLSELQHQWLICSCCAKSTQHGGWKLFPLAADLIFAALQVVNNVKHWYFKIWLRLK